ncbi:MAG TPA: transaldolase [Candidatus Eisenbacteria bacterium]|nr:transaldolase [Candidatus Eisenbacteria bacterium]
MSKSPCVLLHDLGQSVWLDNINDGLLQSGDLARWVREGSVYGVTSNPTIFKNAIGGDKFSYPAEITRLANAGKSPDEVFEELAVRDISRTADLLLDTYRKGSGRDGFVSIEVRPSHAQDTAATIEEARHYWGRLNRPNVFVKVPATPEGIPAIETLIAEGVNINVTLIFGRAQYVRVAEAYKRGLKRRVASGASLAGLHSVASLFVSRLDTSVDKELDERAKAAATPKERERFLNLRGAAAVANAFDVWEEYRAQFFTSDFDALRKAGATPQWILWASTGTKNPAYSDVKYVEELAGPDSINTMPQETLQAFLDHGRVPGDRMTPRVETARKVRAAIQAAGVSIDAHVAKLLEEGVASFAKSFDEMMDVIRERSAALTHRR